MKLIPVFLLAAVVALSGCSSAYQSAQTPDDLYYSPGRQYTGYAERGSNNDEYYTANPNDQYLMMKVRDQARWSTFDNYGYDAYYNPYSSYGSMGLGMGYGAYYGAYSPWGMFGFWNPYYSLSSYYAWNAYYNPYYYYGNMVYVGGKSSSYNTYSGLHPFSSAAYRNNIYSNTNSRNYSNNNNFNRGTNSYYNNNTYRRSFSNNQRNNYNSNNLDNNRSFSQPTRSYTPSTSSFNSGGSGNSGGGGFSRPTRH
ncbi:MAG: hypothetical protein JST47_15310 [Bacteroidetes bacterium]|nr:hypothetical protein [Bacteroidota bacterium]MBS1974826.1 hypothetical protein [Bacteroidota bacterium]